jgi:hypothetical protein
MGEEQQVVRVNQIFSIQHELWFAIINFILNKVADQFMTTVAMGMLNWFTFWKPPMERAKMRRFCAQGRVDGKDMVFDCKLGDFYCAWMKNCILNFLTFTLYGACGGNAKYLKFLDSHMCFADGEGKGDFFWFQANPPGWKKFLVMLGLFCSAFTMHPFLSLWLKKGWLKNCRFGGYGMNLDEISYCKYAKIFFCQCGIFCGGKLNAYLDDSLKAQTLTDQIKVKVEAAVNA